VSVKLRQVKIYFSLRAVKGLRGSFKWFITVKV